MTRSFRFYRIAAVGGLLAFGLFYNRQFRKTLAIRTDAESFLHPSYRLAYGYFLARNSLDMQNQTFSGEHFLFDQVKANLLLKEGADWTNPLNILPDAPVHRYNLKALLADRAGDSGFRALEASVTEKTGTAPVRSRLALSDGFALSGGVRPQDGEEGLVSASRMASFGLELLNQVYKTRDPDVLKVRFKLVGDHPYPSTLHEWPAVYFSPGVNSVVPVRGKKQTAVFSVRAYRNYYLSGNHHMVYIQANPRPANESVIAGLKNELDAGTFSSIRPETRAQWNSLSVFVPAGAPSGRRTVRIARSRFRMELALKDGKLESLRQEYSEDPASVMTWTCGERAGCRLESSSTITQALEMTLAAQ